MKKAIKKANKVKGKKRLNKTLKRRGIVISKNEASKAKDRLDRAFRNIFVKAGVVE